MSTVEEITRFNPYYPVAPSVAESELQAFSGERLNLFPDITAKNVADLYRIAIMNMLDKIIDVDRSIKQAENTNPSPEQILEHRTKKAAVAAHVKPLREEQEINEKSFTDYAAGRLSALGLLDSKSEDEQRRIISKDSRAFKAFYGKPAHYQIRKSIKFELHRDTTERLKQYESL